MCFGAGIWKYYCHVSNQRPRICLVAKFVAKIKILKFRSKNALFWDTIWKKLLSYLKSAPSNFSNCKFGEKKNWGPKMCDSSIFLAEIWKKYCHIWNKHPRICLIAKYHEIMKMANFGTTSTLFGYFWPRILKNYCHIWN